MSNIFKKKKKCVQLTKSLIDIEAERYKKEAREATKRLLELFDKKQNQLA